VSGEFGLGLNVTDFRREIEPGVLRIPAAFDGLGCDVGEGVSFENIS
jgi:hypothetical protein